MPRIADVSNVEKNFILEALTSSKLRLDGRQLDQYRSIDLTYGQQLGNATVTLGKTKWVQSSSMHERLTNVSEGSMSKSQQK